MEWNLYAWGLCRYRSILKSILEMSGVELIDGLKSFVEAGKYLVFESQCWLSHFVTAPSFVFRMHVAWQMVM